MSTTFAARPVLRAAGLAAVGAGVAYTGYSTLKPTSFLNTAHAESLPSDSQASLNKAMVWKGFTELKLKSAEQVNHNVKKLTFALPDDSSISGLSPISKRTVTVYTNLRG